jgi:hypothetical protein
MLRVLLPSLTELDMLWHNHVVTTCFRSDLVLRQLRVLDITFFRDHAIPSAEIWRRPLPALESLYFRAINAAPRAKVAEALTRTLSKGVAFQQLQKLKFVHLKLSDAAAINLLNALVDTGAGQRLTHLTFGECYLGTETARAVGRDLGDDKFPSVTHFSLYRNDDLGDEGAARMQLLEMDFGKIGMTDVGIDAFVTLLSHGVLWDLECLLPLKTTSLRREH